MSNLFLTRPAKFPKLVHVLYLNSGVAELYGAIVGISIVLEVTQNAAVGALKSMQ